MEQLISINEFEEIKKNVYSLSEFRFEKKIKKFIFYINSSYATCDFYSKDSARKGDYIVHENHDLGDSGGGHAISQSEFDKYFSNYDLFCNLVNKHNPYFNKKESEVIETSKSGYVQLTLF